jgi:hypothetical protein
MRRALRVRMSMGILIGAWAIQPGASDTITANLTTPQTAEHISCHAATADPAKTMGVSMRHDAIRAPRHQQEGFGPVLAQGEGPQCPPEGGVRCLPGYKCCTCPQTPAQGQCCKGGETCGCAGLNITRPYCK